jgi:hypothetical protein
MSFWTLRRSAEGDACGVAPVHHRGQDALSPRFRLPPLALIFARIATTDRLTCRRRSLLSRFPCLPVAFILLSLSQPAPSPRRWPVCTQCH